MSKSFLSAFAVDCPKGDRMYPDRPKGHDNSALQEMLQEMCDGELEDEDGLSLDDALSACQDSGGPTSKVCDGVVMGKRVLELAGAVGGLVVDAGSDFFSQFFDMTEDEMDGPTWMVEQGKAFAKAGVLRGTGREQDAKKLEKEWECPTPYQANQLEDGGVPEIRESLPQCYK